MKSGPMNIGTFLIGCLILLILLLLYPNLYSFILWAIIIFITYIFLKKDKKEDKMEIKQTEVDSEKKYKSDVDVKIEEICKEFDNYGETISDMIQERDDRYVLEHRYTPFGDFGRKTREVRLKEKREEKRRKKEKKKLVKEIKKLSGKKINKYLSLRISLDLISNMQLIKIRDYLKGRQEHIL